MDFFLDKLSDKTTILTCYTPIHYLKLNRLENQEINFAIISQNPERNTNRPNDIIFDVGKFASPLNVVQHIFFSISVSLLEWK